jgi:hypothetical protein
MQFLDVVINNEKALINLDLVSHVVYDGGAQNLYFYFEKDHSTYLEGEEAMRVWKLISPNEQRKRPQL